ncbi:aldehyde ferredoxin oxidoreductase family protein [Shumkonia mesophila]|uniref:aldehyde ferredoxin oxidoreductase family protein n=1 Tax=Shumkonia mesophila TaxID=2838854 RepID=UPI0029347B0D|nr:aldehyde ferredoxin oxidoreductase family protein [Shumkonia mesophila]
MSGFHDRIAWVDLGLEKIDIRPLDRRDADAFIGGANLGALFLARLTGADTDPLGAENPLIFMTGPFTGTAVPSGSRHAVVTLSPLTGIYGEASCGGSFGWSLKRVGLDGLVITGQAVRPTVLVIGGPKAISLEDGSPLWGCDAFETDEALKAGHGEAVVTAVIGQAGENRVPLAGIVHGGRHTRMAGRCGVGAVMGSKRLKAIVVSAAGTAETPVADADGLKSSTKAVSPAIRERLTGYSNFGTAGGVPLFERIGNLPIENWRVARDPQLVDRISGQYIRETLFVKRTGCRRCPIICGGIVEVKEGPFATQGASEAPEYETVGGFGGILHIDDAEAIARANELCNRYGLDTISTAGVLGMAAECFEQGLIGPVDTGGTELGFKRPHETLAMIRRMALAEDDFGRLLGRGSRALAQALGNEAEKYAIEVKGLEFPMHDPRFSWGHALSYATGNRGACHLTTLSHAFELLSGLPELGQEGPYEGRVREGKAQQVVHLQNLMNLQDSLVTCKFTMANNTLRISHFLEWYNQITGRALDVTAFMRAGARGFTLKRLINVRRGVTARDDTLPHRMRTLPRVGENLDYSVPPIDDLLKDYYALRDWDSEGRPSPTSVRELGLQAFA